MLDLQKAAEILKQHPAVTKVSPRAEPLKPWSINTNGTCNLEPLLAQLGLVVTKTRRYRDPDKPLWPYWIQVIAARPGSVALDHDTLLALVIGKVLTLSHLGQPASMIDAKDKALAVNSVWGLYYILHRIGRQLYLLRAVDEIEWLATSISEHGPELYRHVQENNQ